MRKALVVLLLGAAMTAPLSSADAQLGWIKGLFGGKKAKPAAEASAAPSAGGAASGAAAPAPNTPPPPREPPMAQANANAMQQPSASAGGGGQPGTSPAIEEEHRKMLEYGRQLDSEPLSVEGANRRVQHWQMMKLAPPFDPEVQQRYDQALRSYEQAKSGDSTSKAQTLTMTDATKKLDRAVYALRANSFSDAESIADDLLASDPTNERARALKAAAQKGEQARRLRVTLVAVGAAAIGLFALFAAFSGKIFKKKEPSEKPSGGGGGGGSGAKVYLKIVDGVGRGRLVQIGGDVYRIGATQGAGEDDRNDLVINDDSESVSRYHCSVVRKGRDYFLIDSSLNGTRLNEKPLARGASLRLRDGDEFTVADVALIKFLKT